MSSGPKGLIFALVSRLWLGYQGGVKFLGLDQPNRPQWVTIINQRVPYNHALSVVCRQWQWHRCRDSCRDFILHLLMYLFFTYIHKMTNSIVTCFLKFLSILLKSVYCTSYLNFTCFGMLATKTKLCVLSYVFAKIPNELGSIWTYFFPNWQNSQPTGNYCMDNFVANNN